MSGNPLGSDHTRMADPKTTVPGINQERVSVGGSQGPYEAAHALGGHHDFDHDPHGSSASKRRGRPRGSKNKKTKRFDVMRAMESFQKRQRATEQLNGPEDHGVSETDQILALRQASAGWLSDLMQEFVCLSNAATKSARVERALLTMQILQLEGVGLNFEDALMEVSKTSRGKQPGTLRNYVRQLVEALKLKFHLPFEVPANQAANYHELVALIQHNVHCVTVLASADDKKEPVVPVNVPPRDESQSMYLYECVVPGCQYGSCRWAYILSASRTQGATVFAAQSIKALAKDLFDMADFFSDSRGRPRQQPSQGHDGIPDQHDMAAAAMAAALDPSAVSGSLQGPGHHGLQQTTPMAHHMATSHAQAMAYPVVHPVHPMQPSAGVIQPGHSHHSHMHHSMHMHPHHQHQHHQQQHHHHQLNVSGALASSSAAEV